MSESMKTISSTSGKSCTLYRPEDLPKYHKQLLDEIERLWDIIRRAHNGDTDDLHTEGTKLT